MVKKIPSIFLRDPADMSYVTREPNPAAAWVFLGKGVATRKYDGTCVMFNGRWWARREVKPGKKAPENWIPVDPDPATGKIMGWEPMEQSGWAKFHTEAATAWGDPLAWKHGTYELIGPKVQGNPERVDQHILIAHAWAEKLKVPDRSYEGIAQACVELGGAGVEGIVWHHPDGRMAKIKVKDFPA